jgi:hypothetical protein
MDNVEEYNICNRLECFKDLWGYRISKPIAVLALYLCQNSGLGRFQVYREEVRKISVF